MKTRIIGYALATAIGLGAGATLSNSVSASTSVASNSAVQHGTDAAFRDGLFMGRHDAEQGRLRHVSTGRWSASSDRSHYQAGYEAAFDATNSSR